MTPNQKVSELLVVLADRGLIDDAVENVREGLWSQANDTFMNDLLSTLSDEDLQSVEVSTSTDEANETLKRIYEEKTGKDMQEEMNRIVDQFATDLIEKYKVEDGVMPPVTMSSDLGTGEGEEKFFASTDTGEHEDLPKLPPAPSESAVSEETKDEEEKVHDLN